MNQQEYGLYLLNLIDAEPMDDDGVTQDDLYGYFQCFMPEGQGIERIFEPLEIGDQLLERIRPLYAMLNPADFEGDSVPGYFNGGQNDASTEQLEAYGKAYLEGLGRLFALEPELAEEAVEAITRITGVQVLEPGEIAAILDDYEHEDEEQTILYETLSEVIAEHTDYEDTLEILSEAYYSIGCDYTLSYHLQWPKYSKLQAAGEPFAPYAELYKRGYHITVHERKLLIGRR
ncbi:hypothetical protein B9G55_04075 [Saccharibacillus sp. O16]|nr:hypothetical protein B9G55_04075 [Saccharibacillus sp. O16]